MNCATLDRWQGWGAFSARGGRGTLPPEVPMADISCFAIARYIQVNCQFKNVHNFTNYAYISLFTTWCTGAPYVIKRLSGGTATPLATPPYNAATAYFMLVVVLELAGMIRLLFCMNNNWFI